MNQNTKENLKYPDNLNVVKNTFSLKGYMQMIKKSAKPTSNVSDGVAFLLRGAKKRRSMAIGSAKMINSDIGLTSKLVAVK